MNNRITYRIFDLNDYLLEDNIKTFEIAIARGKELTIYEKGYKIIKVEETLVYILGE